MTQKIRYTLRDTILQSVISYAYNLLFNTWIFWC